VIEGVWGRRGRQPVFGIRKENEQIRKRNKIEIMKHGPETKEHKSSWHYQCFNCTNKKFSSLYGLQ
jgi:hypothetical protein